MIRLPAHVSEKLSRFGKSQNHAPGTEGAPSRLVELIRVSQPVVSLDGPVRDGESTLKDCIADQTSMNPFAAVSHRDLAERVRDCLDQRGHARRRSSGCGTGSARSLPPPSSRLARGLA